MRKNIHFFLIIDYNINSKFSNCNNNENFVILINVNFYNVIFKIKNNVFKFYDINFDEYFDNQIINDVKFSFYQYYNIVFIR